MADKKMKLDELPDEGSEVPVKISPRSPSGTPKLHDPRLDKLKDADDSHRIQAMSQKWYFDKKEKLWGWLIYSGALLLIEYTRPYEKYLMEKKLLEKTTIGFGGAFNFVTSIEFLIRHPFMLILLVPVFFKFHKGSSFYFEITFDGLSTVKTVDVKKETDLHRTFIKWNEISDAVITKKAGRRVISLSSPAGKIGDLIWDIESYNKSAVKKILRGMIAEKHPLRQLLEKEKV